MEKFLFIFFFKHLLEREHKEPSNVGLHSLRNCSILSLCKAVMVRKNDFFQVFPEKSENFMICHENLKRT